MKKVFFGAMVISLFLTLNVFAKDKPAEAQAQTQAPIVEQAPVKTIFDYKDELKLTDKQITDLKKIISDLQNYITEKRKQLDTVGQELVTMIKDKVALKLIKQKLEQISKVQVDISYTDIESSRKIETILKADQLEKWKKIQEDYRVKLQEELNNKQAEKK